MTHTNTFTHYRCRESNIPIKIRCLHIVCIFHSIRYWHIWYSIEIVKLSFNLSVILDNLAYRNWLRNSACNGKNTMYMRFAWCFNWLSMFYYSWKKNWNTPPPPDSCIDWHDWSHRHKRIKSWILGFGNVLKLFYWWILMSYKWNLLNHLYSYMKFG